ncbi:MAG: Hsp70 family protein, partial [Sorangiineae bacterium]|nr:Hsp70 family protein [Sorangiineae bacterium]
FDLTLLDLSDNVFEVLATAGNTFLGGDDIDLAIAEAMADAFLAQHRYDPRTDPQAFERLRMAAETLKMRLSSLPDATLEVPEVAYGTGGKALGLTFSMTRAELERLARPMLDSSFAVCRDALTIARLSASDFDEVLLVGGTTRIPLVRQMVEEFFSRPALGHISPDEVVAIGAAIQASALAGVERRRATDVPSAPVPARGGSYPFISSKTEPPVQRKSRPPPIPRRPLRTSPGLSSGADTVAVPDTHPFGRPHQDTSPGLMPEPGVDDRASRGGHEPSATLDGLGPRGRVPTGAGLGPSGPRLDRAPPEHPAIPRAVANLPADGSTLMSAAGEAAAARAALEHALPLVDADDSAYDDITQSSASPRAPLSREEAAARYGNLPLSMPEDAPPLPAEPPPAGPPPPPRRARATGLGGTLLLGPEDVPPGPPADPGRALEPDAVRAVAPPRSGDLLGAGRSPTAPRVELASEHTLEIPAAPATEAPLGWGAAPPPLPEPAGPPGWAAPAAVAAAGMGFQPVVAGVAQPPLHASPPAPLLVDVTPLTLTVETVGGFCHTIIARNTPVPCEQARSFVTASDLQTTVRVRVSQGESNRFAENTLLGELELTGLRPAPRGQVEISVLFRLDADGILDVRALDTATGHSASARVRLVGLPESPQVDAMIARHAAHPAL